MSDSIFLIDGESELVELHEKAYDSEALLQKLIAKYPNVLAGQQINPESPRRWLLVTREMGVPDEKDGSDRWSLDHLFLDQDAIPTLVEVKRSSDTRIRREVVGQMLDYAANAVVHWPIESIRAKFESSCETKGDDPTTMISMLLEEENEDTTAEENFWQRVKTNLQAGRIRMAFVADVIPSELRRIIEFLNGQLDPAEVIGVELKQYQDADAQMRTLVPRVVGVTADAQRKKATIAKGAGKVTITREEFFEVANKELTPDGLKTINSVVDWASGVSDHEVSSHWSQGVRGTTFHAKCQIENRIIYPISLWAEGSLCFQMRWLKLHHPFKNALGRDALQKKLEEIPGWTLSNAGMEGFPYVSIEEVKTDADRRKIVESLDWILNQLKQPDPDLVG